MLTTRHFDYCPSTREPVKDHQHWSLAGGYDLEIGHFLKVASMVVTWWIVLFAQCESWPIHQFCGSVMQTQWILTLLTESHSSNRIWILWAESLTLSTHRETTSWPSDPHTIMQLSVETYLWLFSRICPRSVNDMYNSTCTALSYFWVDIFTFSTFKYMNTEWKRLPIHLNDIRDKH